MGTRKWSASDIVALNCHALWKLRKIHKSHFLCAKEHPVIIRYAPVHHVWNTLRKCLNRMMRVTQGLLPVASRWHYNYNWILWMCWEQDHYQSHKVWYWFKHVKQCYNNFLFHGEAWYLTAKHTPLKENSEAVQHNIINVWLFWDSFEVEMTNL